MDVNHAAAPSEITPGEIDVQITLRTGVEWRNKKPNVVVLQHVYGQKPRLKWIAPKPKPKAPKCKCGRRCAYYGPVGGYSVKCKKCNAVSAARQRLLRRGRGKLF